MMAARMLHRPRLPETRRLLLGLGAALALGALFFSGLAVVSGRLGTEPPEPQRVAYFADWNMANRDYLVADVEAAGAAQTLTKLLWAFGDVDSEGLCHIPEEGNYAWELYQRRYDSSESVSGESDEYRQPLAGGLNQLGQLRERHGHLRTGISLGGWNWSRYFSNAALTEETRRAFAESCVDLWLRGNLPEQGDEPQGGDGVAEGVFDGIDVDWEWPAGDGHEHNISRPEDKRNFTLLIAELRRQIDAYAEESGRDLFLTASLPSAEELMEGGVEPEVFDHLDYATVQGFDFTGPWTDVTGHHSQIRTPDSAPDEPSMDAAVQRYLDHGLPEEKLLVGFPAFGRGWHGVPPENHGRFVRSAGPAESEYGGPGAGESYDVLQQMPGRRFFDEHRGAYWLYDGDEWWTYDTPEIVELKGEYVTDHGLGGLSLWVLDQDPDAELVDAMAEALP